MRVFLKRSGSSANTELGGRRIELSDRVFDPGHALQQRNLFRDARLQYCLQAEEERAPIRLLTRQAAEELVAPPFLMGGQQLLQGRHHDERLGVGVGGDVEQRFERPGLSGGKLPGRRRTARGEGE